MAKGAIQARKKRARKASKELKKKQLNSWSSKKSRYKKESTKARP